MRSQPGCYLKCMAVTNNYKFFSKYAYMISNLSAGSKTYGCHGEGISKKIFSAVLLLTLTL